MGRMGRGGGGGNIPMRDIVCEFFSSWGVLSTRGLQSVIPITLCWSDE